MSFYTEVWVGSWSWESHRAGQDFLTPSHFHPTPQTFHFALNLWMCDQQQGQWLLTFPNCSGQVDGIIMPLRCVWWERSTGLPMTGLHDSDPGQWYQWGWNPYFVSRLEQTPCLPSPHPHTLLWRGFTVLNDEYTWIFWYISSHEALFSYCVCGSLVTMNNLNIFPFIVTSGVWLIDYNSNCSSNSAVCTSVWEYKIRIQLTGENM